MAKARIENYNGAPALMIDGVPYPPMCATIRNFTDDPEKTSMVIDTEYYKSMGESGVKVFFLICDTEWLKPGAFELLNNEAQTILSAVPDAYLILRIGMHPPAWWCDENPDETLSYSDGKKKPAKLSTESFVDDYKNGIYSFCSQKWRDDASSAFKEFYKMVEKSAFGDRVIGYFFSAGGTSEWYYLSSFNYTEHTVHGDSNGFCQYVDEKYNGVYGDLSPAFKREFSLYLKEKYGSDENLQKAWKDSTVTIDNPSIPDCDARYFISEADYEAKLPANTHTLENLKQSPSNGNNIGQFLDIDKRMDVFDFYRALNKGTANAIIHFGKVLKEINPDMICGSFYGSSCNTRFFDYGKIGYTDHVLCSGVVDFLATTCSYENRAPGGFPGQKMICDTFRLKNAMFMAEDDVRTHLENHTYRTSYSLYDIEDSRNVMKREFGRTVCQGIQSWWFDQHIGGGRYKHPELYKLMKRMQEISKDSYECDRRKNSDIAIIYDEESFHVISEEGNQQLIDVFRDYDIDIVGAPIDRYIHNDMEYDEMPDYKLYIFANTLYLSDSERTLIKKKLSKNHATAVFMYGAGIINPDRDVKFSEENTAELTGIKTKILNDSVYCERFKISGEHPIVKKLDEERYYGEYDRRMQFNSSGYMGKTRTTNNFLFPVIYAEDDTAETLGCFLDTEKTAIAIKDNKDFTSIYCGAKYINSDIVRSVAEFAGCHIYCDTNDVLYADKNYITFHASSSGEKVIKLPKKASALEVYENKYYSKDSDEIRFTAKKGKTLMFKIQK